MISYTSDAVLYYKHDIFFGSLSGILSKFDDKVIFVGKKTFLRHISTLRATFDRKLPISTPFPFILILFKKTPAGFYKCQEPYFNQIETLPENTPF